MNLERERQIEEKSDQIVRALRALGIGENEIVIDNQDEVMLKDFNQGNLDQVDVEEGKTEESELLNEEVLGRILKESKKAMIQIITRAYNDAYYESFGFEPGRNLIKI
jgi:hypothetical protein